MGESRFLAKVPEIDRGLLIRALIVIIAVAAVGQAIMGLTTIQVVTLAVGGAALVLFGRRPELALSVLLVIIASIVFVEALPLLPIPGGSLLVTDVLLLYVLGLIPFKLLMDNEFRFVRTPLDLPMALFLAATVASAANGILVQGLDFNIVMRLLRSMMYYAVFYVVTSFIREMRQIRFMAGAMFAVAGVVSAAMFLQAVVGEGVRLMPGRIEAAETFRQAFDATRILPPGDILVLVTFIMALTALASQRTRMLAAPTTYLLFLLGGGVLLTYNRNYWGSIVAVLLILMALGSKRAKARALTWVGAAAIVVAVLVPALAGTGGKLGSYYESIGARFNSLFSPNETFSSRSLEWRKIEVEYAWLSALRHPLAGIGLGQDYRPRIDWMDFYRQGRVWSNASYIHNGYLYILVDMGLAGLVPFLWLLALFQARGFRAWKRIADPSAASLLLGLTLGGSAILMSSLVAPRFLEWPGIFVLTLIMGLAEGVIRLEGPGAAPPAEGSPA